MDQWDGQGGDPAGGHYDEDWQEDGTGYNDQLPLDDPHGSRDPRTLVPDDTEENWYEDDYQDYDNYTTGGSLDPLTTSFENQSGHAPLATSHQKHAKPGKKKNHAKEASHHERRDDGRNNRRDQRPAAQTRPSEKKVAKQEATEKHGAGKKGKNPATSEELNQTENVGFDDSGNNMYTPYGDEAYGLDSDDFFQDDPTAMEQGIARSLNTLSLNSQPSQGESSASGGTYVVETDPNQSDMTVSPWGSQYPAPKPSHTIQNYNVGIQKSDEWKFGHMLYIWWTEPKGAKGSNWTFKKRTRDNVWEGWRRFMIISQNNTSGNSKCVPVTTYQGQGVTKPKKPEHHGIVFDSKKSPVLATKEPKLGYRSIAVDMLDAFDTLHEYSRINYNKIHTIEHNLPCSFLGQVTKADLGQFKIYAQRALKC